MGGGCPDDCCDGVGGGVFGDVCNEACDGYTTQACASAGQPIDLELVSVEQLDGGDGVNGAAYRVTFRNNSDVDVAQEFDVALLASADGQTADNVSQTTSRVAGIGANQALYVDMRLPAEANGLGVLTAMVNSSQDVAEATLDNNSTTLNQSDIPLASN